MLLTILCSSRQAKRTKVVKESLNPTWNADFTFVGSRCEPIKETSILRIALWDEDRLTDDDFLGELIVPVGFLTAADEKPHWRTVEHCPGSSEFVSGEVFMSIAKQGEATSDGDLADAAPAAAKKQKGKGGKAASAALDPESFGLLPQYVVDPTELDFTSGKILGEGSFGTVRLG